MEAMKLRSIIWEHRIKIEKFKSICKEMGLEYNKDELEKCLQNLENLEAKLCVAEFELQVPGAVFNREVAKAFEDLPHSDAFDYFLRDEDRARQPKEGAKLVSETSWWVNAILSEKKPLILSEKKPLVMEGEVNQAYKHKQTIVNMLVESGNNELSVIPIIGMPGTGKTTLSQHVYHDSRVSEYFKVRHWVSMSDIREGPSKLLNLVFRHKTSDADILKEFNDIVKNERYLLIVDDMTQRNCGEFLHKLLCNVSPGSKIILTALDMATLGNMEPLPVVAPYELGCLSDDEAWSLFKSIAFDDVTVEDNRYKTDIGFNICREYASLPRLLKNLAMILQTREDWEYICDKLLNSSEDSLESNLSKVNLISYKKLPSNIQQCVKYCSLFPADYKFIKADLLHLWNAQKFFLSEEKKPENLLGDEYFEELLNNRYLIGDNEDDINNNVIVSYKMESIMNEFLKNVAKPDFHLVDEGTGEIDRAKILHLSFHVTDSTWEAPLWLPEAKKLLSLLFLPSKPATVGILPNIDVVLSSLRQLQALDLAAVKCEGLPQSLGKLTALRYLRLGASSEYLPQEITSLRNLKTLDLRLSSVTVLPRGFHMLQGLKHLYTGDRLLDMPPHFGRLKYLQTLDVFIMGNNNSIDALSKLTKLVGKLKVRYDNNNAIREESNSTDGLFKETYLTDISLIWSSSYGITYADANNCLQPPPSLKSLSLMGWKGVRFPQQLRIGFPSLSSLDSLHIENFNRCKSLPDFSTLPNLRSLELWDLTDLESIETTVNDTIEDFFPSLKFLMLANLPNLKRWSSEQDSSYIFPSLVEFRVSCCEKLISIPRMQKLESLEAHDVQGTLLRFILSSQLISSSASSTLKTLIIVSIHELDSLSIKSSLESLTIMRCCELETLEVESSKLKKLEVHECRKLEDITMNSPVQHSMLEELTLKSCEAFHWWGMVQDGKYIVESNECLRRQAAWEKLKFLRSLKLINFTLETLPECIGKISQLRCLSLRNWPYLTALPESLGQLSHLEELQIQNCSRLKEIPESVESLCTPDISGCPKLRGRHQQDDGQN